MKNIILRSAKEDDLSLIAELDKNNHIEAWTLGMLQNSFTNKNSILILETTNEENHAEKIIAFIVFSNQIKEWEILNFVVAKEERHQGYGKILLNKILQHASEAKATCIFLEVRATNKIATQLYKKCGFQEIGRRKDYYVNVDGHKEDAIIMKKFPKAFSFPQTTNTHHLQ